MRIQARFAWNLNQYVSISDEKLEYTFVLI